METRWQVDETVATAVKDQVGEIAGQVWDILNLDGPQTLDQLSVRVDGARELLNFALGWLVRGGAVDIVKGKIDFWVRLRGFDRHSQASQQPAPGQASPSW